MHAIGTSFQEASANALSGLARSKEKELRVCIVFRSNWKLFYHLSFEKRSLSRTGIAAASQAWYKSLRAKPGRFGQFVLPRLGARMAVSPSFLSCVSLEKKFVLSPWHFRAHKERQVGEEGAGLRAGSGGCSARRCRRLPPRAFRAALYPAGGAGETLSALRLRRAGSARGPAEPPGSLSRGRGASRDAELRVGAETGVGAGVRRGGPGRSGWLVEGVVHLEACGLRRGAAPAAAGGAGWREESAADRGTGGTGRRGRRVAAEWSAAPNPATLRADGMAPRGRAKAHLIGSKVEPGSEGETICDGGHAGWEPRGGRGKLTGAQ
ncbi:spidroin-1-like [Cebus imitator]|uniref:spidroin-1-like n=1 Tax=Cebus imitator TaxID=2715852 RepID=UPI00189C3CDF|nr:spidroin-1-like [Cebus imitator]